MIVAVFDPSPLTVCINCSFFTYIFAVLWPDFSRLHLVILYSECFWKWTRDIMRINQSKSATTGADFRNGMVKRVKLSQHAKFHGDRYNHRRDIAIFRLFKMAVAAIMDFLIFDFFEIFNCRMAQNGWNCAKFRRHRSNRGPDMAVFRFFKIAAVAMLDFEIWNS